jgi:hypothetical protein
MPGGHSTVRMLQRALRSFRQLRHWQRTSVGLGEPGVFILELVHIDGD